MNHHRRIFPILAAALAFSIVCGATSWSIRPNAQACSRIFWNESGRSALVARSLDWVTPMPVDLYALPRGIERDGMTGAHALRWKAKYGSVVAATQGGASDGLNEKGLAAHLLWLSESEYGVFDPDKPSMGAGLWAQYALDNFATVDEFVSQIESHPFQIVPGVYDGLKTTVHLSVEDPSGDSAVVEYREGAAKIYHGREFSVMTNDPPFDEQLRRMKTYRGFGGEKPLPGTSDAADRFVRAAFFLNGLPKPRNDREAVAEILSVIRNVSQPYSKTDLEAMREGRPHNSVTRWRTVADLTKRVYYYESSMNPNLIWVKLNDLKFDEGTPITKLDMIDNPEQVGDCSKRFTPSKPFLVVAPQLD